ncbi:hypothetical protein BDW71DRAFT_212684 [Aspergillus fruticulosus]
MELFTRLHTQWPVAGAHWLVDQIAAEAAVARTFTTQGEASSTEIQKNFQQVTWFKEKVAVAVHYVKTETNMRRNIFIKDEIVVIVTARTSKLSAGIYPARWASWWYGICGW